MRYAVLACLLAGFVMLLLPGSAAERPVEDFTHAVIGEEFTTTWCVYCPSAAENLNKVWQPKSEYPDDPYYHDQFFFVALITDVNDKAGDRAGDYPDFAGYPTVYFDGGDEKVEGGQSDTSNYEQAIDSSGGRSDTDISLRIAMQHLGDDRIAVQVYITWNEDAGFGNPDFSGYIRAYIVEPVSRYDNYDGNPYHFGFLDYAFDQQVVLDPHEEVVLETVWIGGDHNDSEGNDFSDISYNNLNIFVSFFNDESTSADDYALQSAFAIPPQTSFEFPTGNLSDTVSLPGSASQLRSAIAAVEYSVDGGEWQLADGTDEFDLMLDTTAYGNGAHELVLRITDTAGTTLELAGNLEILNDSEPPIVTWLEPAADSEVTGLVALAASASDNSAIAKVEYRVGEGTWRQMTYAGDDRWEVEWNTEETGGSNGLHTLEVRALDDYGNEATDSLELDVQNEGDITYPALEVNGVPGTLFAGPLDVTITASDPDGVASVEYQIDGGAWHSVDENGFRIITAALPDGVHSLLVRAVDGLDYATEVSTQFECDNTAPVILLDTFPDPVTAELTLTFATSDYAGIESLQYRVGGSDWTSLPADATEFTWDSTLASDGSWLLEIEASDLLGNRDTTYRTLNVENAGRIALLPVADAQAGSPVEIRAFVDYPDPLAVYLLVAGQRLPMQTGPAGWSAKVTLAEAGSYGYRVEVDTGHGSFQGNEQMLNIGEAAALPDEEDALPAPSLLVAAGLLTGIALRRRR
ncbi:MAG: hypothetical protein CXT74_04455 [Methanobacteriota archaeon]|nr:MAG: hypothetical protein CXT74_04455 [Euryarchaeota archaeon]HIL33532.1 hypothetical protein [Candidatus Poseidoniales archaeon]